MNDTHTDDEPRADEAGGPSTLAELLDDHGRVRRGLSGLDAAGEWLAEHRGRVVGIVLALVALGAIGSSRISPGAVIVDGLSLGAIYALVALGIALVYRATRVLNFAQGEFGTVPAFAVLVVLLGFDLDATVDPSQVGLGSLLGLTLGAVLLGAILAIVVNTFIVQRLAEASPVTSLVATAGVSFLLIGTQVVVFGLQSRAFPRFLEGSVSILGIAVTRHTFVIAVVLAAAAALLAALFRTPLGVALLATAQDPFAAALHGVSTRLMSSLAWGLAGGLAAVGGVLGAGIYQRLEPGQMTTTFLIPAFTAAVLGGLTSMVGAVVGGLLLGLVSALMMDAVLQYDLTSTIPGPADLATFVVLLLVLLVRPRGLFGKEA